MSELANPNTIIVKNNFYLNGLTEKNVWDYYQKYKGIILNNTRGRDIMLGIAVDLNKIVFKRKGNIRLTNNNYNSIITGRKLVIYSTMKAYEDFCVVDIDINDWKKAKQTTQLIYNQLHEFNFIRTIKILFTGKNAFHIHCKFRDRYPITKAKSIIEAYLKQNQNHLLYTIQHKRLANKPNIDLSPNKFKGAYITEGSLSMWGLKCIEVKLNELNSFEPWKAKI